LEVPATYYRGIPSNQAAHELEWLKAKVGELEQAIDRVDETVDREQAERGETSSQLSYSDDVRALIAALSKQFGDTLEALSEDVSEILARLDPQHPELNQEDWATVAKLRLAEEQALTSNLFTREDGVELNRLDVYVPLGLVERRKPERLLPFGRNDGDNVMASGTQWSEAISTPGGEGLLRGNEEKITPISEDRFFTDVLQQGKSPQSGGKRLAIIGEPGSGKTTRLQAISRWILDNPRFAHLGILADATGAQSGAIFG